jgi:hypothetical protein
MLMLIMHCAGRAEWKAKGYCMPGCAAIVGDITPNCGVSKEEKQRLEADAIADIQKMLGGETTAGTRCQPSHALHCAP